MGKNSVIRTFRLSKFINSTSSNNFPPYRSHP
jgi:hypothetical protein